jgi:hypothetical protein
MLPIKPELTSFTYAHLIIAGNVAGSFIPVTVQVSFYFNNLPPDLIARPIANPKNLQRYYYLGYYR